MKRRETTITQAIINPLVGEPPGVTRRISRRRLLRSLGAAGAAGVAGCGGRGSPESGTAGGKNAGESATTTGSDARTTETPTPNPDVTVRDDFADLGAWTAVEGSLSAASTDARSGSGSGSGAAKLTAGASADAVRIRRSVDWDLSGEKLSLAVNVASPPDNVIATVRLFAPDESRVVELGELVRPAPDQGWFRMDLGTRRMTGVPDLSTVTAVEVALSGAGEGPVEFSVDRLVSVPKLDAGYVALTFDDSTTSQYAEAFRIMQKYDIPGTVATITGSVGAEGHLTTDQMSEMKNAGWEFASHTHGHTNLASVSAVEVRKEIEAARTWLTDHGFQAGARNLVYPYGGFDTNAVAVVKEYHDAAYRYNGTRSAGTGRVLAPYTVSRGNAIHRDRAKNMMSRAAHYNELGVFAFHKVGDADGITISTADFEDVIRHLSKLDVEVVTLSEMLDGPAPVASAGASSP